MPDERGNRRGHARAAAVPVRALALAAVVAALGSVTMANVAWAQPAGAEPRPPAEISPVIILGRNDDGALVARIRAELRAIGLAPESRVLDKETAASELDRVARQLVRAGTRAIVFVDGRAGRTEVLVPGAAGTGIRLRQVLEGAALPAVDPLLVVRTVELVRASLLEPEAFGPAPSPNAPPVVPPRSPVAAPAAPATRAAASPVPPPSITNTPSSSPAAPVETIVPPPPATPLETKPPAALESRVVEPGVAAGPPIWRVGLGSGVSAARGGLGPQAVAAVFVRVRAGGRIHLELGGLAPLTASGSSATEGSSQSRVWIAMVGLLVRRAFADRGAIEVGAGIEALWLRATGTVAAGTIAPAVTSATDTGLGTAVHAHVGGELSLGRRVALRLDLVGGDVFRRPVLRIGGDADVAAWGPLQLLALGGVELRWF